jgi:hypothetical protein
MSTSKATRTSSTGSSSRRARPTGSSSTLPSLPPSLALRHLWPVADQVAYLQQQAEQRAQATQSQTRRTEPEPTTIERDWHQWLPALFPDDRAPLAAHHGEFWDWLWAMPRDISPDPFIGIWSRGGAKSTNVERGCAAAGALGKRHYALYVCGTQEQADKHVASIAGILDSPRLAAYYPLLTSPALNRFGSPKGWRRNRLRTAAGFTIDALGLNTAVRGIRIDDYRPDLIIIDDIDEATDSSAVTDTRVELLTKKILPAGAPNMAVIGVQNLIGSDTVFARLARYQGAATIDMLHNRTVSGPYKALDDFEYVEREGGGYQIVNGRPTWKGQGVAECQAYIDTFGLTAFLSECQHEVDAPPGGMFDHLAFRQCEQSDLPSLLDTVVWVDPAVTNKDRSDCQGIQADGRAEDGTIYRLYSWEGRTTPQRAIIRALIQAVQLRASSVGIETDQGGDTWDSVFREAVADLLAGSDDPDFPFAPMDARHIRFKSAKAGAGEGPKVQRAQQQLFAYERGEFVHVRGTHVALERALKRFPKTKPFDLVDAGFWSWHDLTKGVPHQGAVAAPRPIVQRIASGYRPMG